MDVMLSIFIITVFYVKIANKTQYDINDRLHGLDTNGLRSRESHRRSGRSPLINTGRNRWKKKRKKKKIVLSSRIIFLTISIPKVGLLLLIVTSLYLIARTVENSYLYVTSVIFYYKREGE